MSNKLKNINLPQRLIERLNSEVYEISYTLIATYLLRNYKNIKNLTIKEICNNAFVSKSTLRRFCNNIGYKNFSELKSSYVELKDDSKFQYPNQSDEYLKVIYSIQKIDISLIDKLIDEIKRKKYIFFLFPYDLYSSFYEFQREMLGLGKLIHILPNIDLHFDDIKFCFDESLIFIVDFDASYIDTVIPYLDQINSTNILLTNQNRSYENTLMTVHFDNYHLKSLRKYQLSLFLDFIISKYNKRGNV